VPTHVRHRAVCYNSAPVEHHGHSRPVDKRNNESRLKENRRLAARLADIAAAPPVGMSRNFNPRLPCHDGSKAYQIRQEGKKIMHENQDMKRRVQKPGYSMASGGKSYAQNLGVQEVNLARLWPHRGALWDAPPAIATFEVIRDPAASWGPVAAAAVAPPRPSTAPQGGTRTKDRGRRHPRPAWNDDTIVRPGDGSSVKEVVPKALGMVKCAGCGREKFWKGDGKRDLFPCEKCGRAYYCTEACALIDAPYHRRECVWITKGLKATRGDEDCWVTNEAYAKVRQKLREKKLSPEEVWRLYEKLRSKELVAEARAADQLKRAGWGLEGSVRPCCVTDIARASDRSAAAFDPNLTDARPFMGGRTIKVMGMGRRVFSARKDPNAKGGFRIEVGHR